MAFVRTGSKFRSWLGADERFPYEAGRYVLYVSVACPWANRALQVARIKRLDPASHRTANRVEETGGGGGGDAPASPAPLLGVVRVHPTWQRTRPGEDAHCGWVFAEPGEGLVPLALQEAADGSVQANRAGNSVGTALEEVVRADPAADVTTSVGTGPRVVTEFCEPDTLSGLGARSLRELYERSAEPATLETGKFTTPMLWDTKTRQVVNNESADLIQMFDAWPADPAQTGPALDPTAKRGPDLAPAHLADEMRHWDEVCYEGVNNGVYRCGFARSQSAYDEAIANLTRHMQILEDRFAEPRPGGAPGQTRRFLAGDQLTLSDVRLFQTLIRMEDCYVCYFKCRPASLLRFPHVLQYTAGLWKNFAAIRETTYLRDCMLHYYSSHPRLNDCAIVPAMCGVEDLLLELAEKEGL